MTVKLSWNPEIQISDDVKNTVKKLLASSKLRNMIERFAQQARNDKSSGFETEHVIWLGKQSNFYARIWYEKKMNIVIEDMSTIDDEVAYLILDNYPCETFDKIIKIEPTDKPHDLGVNQ